MNNKPFFTVVICTYNDGKYLKQAIESVLVQTQRNWELIIVNDGSKDCTRDILETYKEHPSVVLIHRLTNMGKGSCMNVALERAKGYWMLELDADDWLENNCLEMLEISILQYQNGIVFFYGKYIEWRERARDGKLYFSAVRGKAFINYNQYLDNPKPIAPRVYKVAELKKIKGWCEKDIYKGRVYEDVYVVCVLAKNGDVQFIDETLYNRRLRKNSASNSNSAQYIQWKDWFIENN